MFSVGSRKNRAAAKKAESPSSFGINFYNDTPTVELDLDTFEIYALKRLKVRFTDEEERIWHSFCMYVSCLVVIFLFRHFSGPSQTGTIAHLQIDA